MIVNVIEKVTAFITQQTDCGHQLLLLEHPYAGIQIPAGTVESFENPEQAVIRETAEETGLTDLSPPTFLGCQESQLDLDKAIILPPAKIFARPDHTSFDWIEIRSAVQVNLLRKESGFTQIKYTEPNQVQNPNYISMQILGWVPDNFLAGIRRRHFFHLKHKGPSPSQWTVFSDHHTFNLFWASWNDLPAIVPPQDTWLVYLENSMIDRS